MNFKYKITLFTPTYNRAYILETLYRSLQRQTCTDFEWLVVDDGSTDDTAILIKTWQRENTTFPIRYYRQENGGKHRAINRGLELAEGELFFIVDSDDYLTDDAVEIILKQIVQLPDNCNEKYAGICNCKGFSVSQIVGTTFLGEHIDCTFLERDQYGITGDKAEVFFSDVLRKYPFPEFDGENFMTEAVVWDRMAADGWKIRFFNQITYLCEYREDGLTKQGLDLYYRNPQGYALYLRQCQKYKKYTLPVQTYFEVQCCKAWIKTMSLNQIAELLSVNPSCLLWKTIKYESKEIASRIKHKIMEVLK